MRTEAKKCACGKGPLVDPRTETCDSCSKLLADRLRQIFGADEEAAGIYRENLCAVSTENCPVEEIPEMLKELQRIATGRKMTAPQSLAWLIAIGGQYLGALALQCDSVLSSFITGSARIASEEYLRIVGMDPAVVRERAGRAGKVSFRVRVRRAGGHWTLTFFGGRENGTRANLGTLTMSDEESAAMVARLAGSGVEIEDQEPTGGRS